eukprot:GSChrysophyteH1.ASY1.ANO1.961.1 assembled CDS
MRLIYAFLVYCFICGAFAESDLSRRDLVATSCPAGEYLSSGQCVVSPAGSYATRTVSYISPVPSNYMSESICTSPDMATILVFTASSTSNGYLKKSTDGGSTWTTIPRSAFPGATPGITPLLYPYQIWCSPDMNNILLANGKGWNGGSSSGFIMMSNNGGQSFLNLYGLGMYIFTGVGATPDMRNIIASAVSRGLLISNDGGATFARAKDSNGNILTQLGGASVANNQDMSIIYAAAINGYIYKSGDGGSTWNPVYSTNRNFRGIACTSDMVICQATIGSGSGSSGGILTTIDSGNSWAIKYPVSTGTSNPVSTWYLTGIAMSPSGSKVMVVWSQPSNSNRNGLLMTADSGKTWTPWTGSSTLTTIYGAVAPTGGAIGSAMCPSGYFSISGAATCKVCPLGKFSGIGSGTCLACPDGSTTPGAGAMGPTSARCNVCAPGYYSQTGYANAVGGCSAVAAGYYPSLEVTTTSLTSGTKIWTGVAVSEDFTKIAVCRRSSYIYLSVDSGSSWNPLMSATIQDWLGITGNPTLTKLAATCSGCNIKLSLDGGLTWTDLEASGKTSWIGIAASSDFNSMVASQYGNGKLLYRTDDGGASWNPLEAAGTNYWHLLTASADLTNIAATEPTQGFVYISSDSGTSFASTRPCDNGDGLWDVTASYDFNKIIATCTELYISTDKGSTWSVLGSRPTTSVQWIGITGNFDLSRMVATSGSTYIYQTDDAAVSWQGLFGDIIGAPAPNGYATQETSCPPGTYSAAIQSSCTLCPQGTFSMPGNTTFCTPCDTGYTTPGVGMIATSQSICSVCAPGYLSYNGLASSVGAGCKISEAGQYPVRGMNIRSYPGDGYFGASASFDFSYIIVTSKDHLFLSSNSGASWDRVDNVPSGTYGWRDVFVSGDFKNIIATNEYLRASYDSGLTWSTFTSAGQNDWYGVVATPDLQSIVATTGGIGKGQVLLSTDGGALFGPLRGAGTADFRGVTANQELTKIIAVDLENRQVCISMNSGATWTTTYLAACYGITSSFNFQNVAVACTVDIYFSVDSGTSFLALPYSKRSETTFWSGIVGNFDLSKMFIASNMTDPKVSSMFMQSDDSGQTWVQNGLITGAEARRGYGSKTYPCVAGSYAAAGSYACTSCPKGTYSAAGASACTKCPVGYTTPGVGIAGTSSSVCDECALGLFSKSGLATESGKGCTTVPAGSYPTTTVNVQSFIKVPAPELEALYSVAVSNDLLNIAICEASGYIQLSKDSGQTWTPMIGAGKHFWTAVKGTPQFEGIVATHFNGMAVSLDGGATWNEKSNNPMSDLNGIYKSLAITADLTSMLVICHSQDGKTKKIYRTDNTAGTWYEILSNLGGSPNYLVASHDLTMIYINAYTSLYKVTYAGSIVSTKLPVQLGPGNFGGLAASYDFKTVVTSYDGGLAISTDGGDTFQKLINAPQGSFNGIAGNADLSKIVALDYNNADVTKNLYQSADSGQNWILNGAITGAVAINGKATGTSPCPGGTYAPNSGGGRCLVCPAGKFSSGGATACTSCPTGHTTHGPGAVGTNQATVCTDCAPGYYGTGTGTCTMVPAGSFPSNPMSITPLTGNTGTTATWTAAAISADNSKMIAIQQKQYIYLTTNSGANWVPLTSAGTGDYRGVCTSQDFMKIAVAEYLNYIKVSYDGGASWVQLPRDHLGGQTGIQRWVDIRTNPAFTVMVALVENSYIYKSVDGGNSWVALAGSQSSQASSKRNYVKLASSEDMRKLIATAPADNAVSVSTDGGETWQLVVEGNPFGAIVCTYDFSVIIAARTTNTVLYISKNDGSTWATLAASSLKVTFSNLKVLSLGASPDLQFAAITTTSGVYFAKTYPDYIFSSDLAIENGIFPTGGATTKALCGLGQFSEAGATRCSECPAATYTDSYGSKSCTKCATGYTNQGPGYIESACTICAPGFIGQTSGVNSVCSVVPSGSYPVRTGPLLSSREEWGGIAASSDFATLVAAGEQYLQISSDSGVNWLNLASAGRKKWGGVYGSPNMQNLLATARSIDYVYMSTDKGLTWKNLPSAGTASFAGVTATPDLHKIVTVAQYQKNCGSACEGFVKISTDYGANFQISNNAGSNNWVAVTSNEDLSKVLIAAKGGYLYMTTNLGVLWTKLLSANTHSWTALAASADLQNIVAFNADPYESQGANRRLVSTDGGNSWLEKGSLTLGQNIFTGAVVSPDFVKQAIVGTGVTSAGFYVTYSGDGGKTWSWTSNTQAIAPNGGGMRSALCVPGTYSTGGAALCTFCPEGKYSQGGATSCTACSEGYTTAGPGFAGSDNSVCSVCAKGYKSKGNTDGTTSCIALYAPSQSDTTTPNCSYCPAGKYSPTHGASECTSCEAGKFSDVMGLSSSCQLCQPGTFSTGNAATACTSCPAGQYSSVGATSCAKCPAGNYNPNTGSTLCSPCVSGTYTSETGATVCGVCPAGRFSGPGANTCTDCQAGYSAPLGQPCSPCPPNTFSTGGTAYCAPCAAGSTSNAGAKQCKLCSAGFFALQGQSCMLCPAGRYADQEGSAYCTECPDGGYSTDGSTTCQSCIP